MAALQMTRPRLELLLVAAAVVLVSGALPTPAGAQTVVVTNTADAGAGSLRDAIAAVNAGTATTIDMTGVAGNITLVTPLPALANPVTINGAGPALTIDGTALGEVLLDTGAGTTLDTVSILDLTKDGAGTLTVTGTSTLADAVSVGEGTLALGGAIAGIEYLAVDSGAQVTLLAGQTLGDIELADAGLIDLGANTLTLNGSGGFGSIVSGTIAGAGGGLHVSGNAGVAFGLIPGFGQGTYTGTTRASGDGYLGLFGDQVLSAQTGLVIEDNGIIEIDGINTFASLSGTGGELWLCDCSQVTIDQDVDTTFAGVLLGDPASAFVKAGSGRLALTGDTTGYFGALTVSGGVLAGTTSSLLVDITNNATVEFDQAFAGAYGEVISGTGSLVKSGTGAVELTSANTYTGGTVVNAGTLIVGTDDALGFGSLTMNGGTLQVDFDQDVASLSGTGGTAEVNALLGIVQAADTTFGGIFSGSGEIEKLGAGVLTLTGVSTFSGDVVVSDGTLALGGTGALSNVEFFEVDDGGELRLLSDQAIHDVDVLAGGTLAVGAHTLTLNSGSFGSFIFGNITGTGAMVVDGVTGIAVVNSVDFSGSVTFAGDSSSVLLADNALAQASAITVNDNAYLEIEGVQTFSSLSGNGGEIFLCDCATLTVDQDIDTTFAGILSADPDATFTKAGAGRLMLAGDGSGFFGSFVVSGGTLAGTTDSLRGDILNDATVEFDQDFSGTWSNILSGAGGLVKSGSGTVLLDGFNTYTGGTTVNEGRLHAFGNDVIGSGGLTVNGGEFFLDAGSQTVSSLSGSGGTVRIASTSVLTVDQASNTTYAGQITDAGSLVKTGSGALTLTGTNSYTGGTTVSDGMLIGTVNSLQGDILNDATVEFDQSSVDGTYAGDMSGTGALLVTGGGTLTLTGTNSYSGGTTVSAGNLIALADDALGFGALTMNGGSVGVYFGQAISSLDGSGGTLSVNGLLDIDQAGDTTYGGALAGFGAIEKTGAGTLTLTGAGNFFQGEVAVFGGTLALEGAGALSTAEFLEVGEDGQVRLLSDQTLGAMAIEGTLAVGANTLTLDTGALGALVSGNITGTGALVVGGTTDFALGSQLAFSGSVTFGGDSSSVLLVGNALANASGVRIDDNAYLAIEGTQTFRSLAGNGGELFLCDCAALAIDQAIETTFSGALSGDAGSLFIKDGTGRLTLSGDGSGFFGTLVVAGGVLEGTTTSLTSDIVNNAVVEFNQGGNGTFAGVMSGVGAMVKSGSGTLTLTGANSYAGGTTIAGGTLLVESDANLGGASGAVTFEAGTLGILDGFASARDFVFAGAGTFDTGAHEAVLSGAVSGGGSLTKTGSGALLLTGTASHTGGTRVLDGTLVGTTASLQGDILNEALVVFQQDAGGVFAGTISGSGQVAKIGGGALTIAGAQTYSGDTFVVEGGLRLDGSLAGSVFVDHGAAFSGSGAVGGDVFVNGTFMAGALPGGSGGGDDAGAGAHAVIPPMAIAGDLLLTSTAVYQAQVDEDAAIATLAVGGSAIIDGATLHLVETGAGIGSTARRASSTVLTAAEVIGGFGAVTGLSSSFDPYFFVSGGSANLLLVRNDVDFAAFASSFNGSAVGAALVAAQASASDDLSLVTRELSALETDAEVAAALDRISGAAHASVAGISLIATADALDVLTSRFAARSGWWLQGFGSALRLEADVDPLASATDIRGVLAGYDRAFGPMRFGVAAGYQDTGVDASGGLDRIDGRAYRAALYGQYRAGRLFVDGVLGAASHAIRGSRGIDFAARLDPAFGGGLLFGGVSRTAGFDYDAMELTAATDAGYAVTIGPLTLQPAAGLQITRFAREGFTESGAGSLDLSAADASTSGVAARARLSVERTVDRAAPRWFAPRAGVRYTRELRDRAVPFAATIGGAPFTAVGFAMPQSLLAAQAGIAAGFGAVTLSIDYRAAVAAGHRHHLISAGFGF